ncbi:MAG TPA: thiol peroxidase [Candidatus Limnocylindrales bacterium]|nr:thiol peroxidase [Candidatus Limnocylindrales bacterium]
MGIDNVDRVAEAFELDERLTVGGRRLVPGEVAPNFDLDRLDPATGVIGHRRLADTAGRVRLLNVVNSLDTSVCAIETRRFEAAQATLSDAIVVFTISMDLPYAQARWNAEAGVTHETLSAHRSEDFGLAYGTLIREWRLLQRAVFVIDRKDRLTHVEYVADQMAQPDYEAALSAARAAAQNH